MSKKQNHPRRARHFLHKILNRITLTGLLVAVQLAWLVWFTLRLSQYALGIDTLFTALSLLLSLYIVRREENPAYKLCWVIVLSALPLFGMLIYSIFGNKRPGRQMQKRLARVEESHRTPPVDPPKGLPPRFRATCEYLSRHANAPAYTDTRTSYYPLGESFFAAMLSDLEEAKRTIFLEYFIVAEGKMLDTLLDVLSRKAAAGVDVRILYDDIGSEANAPLSFVTRAEKMGIRTLGFNRLIPFLSIVMNHRDHRKITVIDGRIAYTGGINIADEYINQKTRFGHWKDTGVRLCGRAATGFASMFLDLWNALRPTETDYAPFLPTEHAPTEGEELALAVQPYTDSPLDSENVGETVYLDILAQAERYVYIFTPYLIIDSEMQMALCSAAKRGVDVRLVVPGIPDKRIAYRLTRSYYGVLMRAGVRIYEYTPGFLHAKSFVADDRIGVVGSINMDYRSLYLHFECGVLFIGGRAVARLKQDCLETMDKSHEVTERESSRPKRLILRFFDALLRAISPLF